MRGVKNAFINEAPKNAVLRHCQRSVTYPMIGLTMMLKIGMNVKMIPMISTGMPRCLAMVGRNGFIGDIPEIIN